MADWANDLRRGADYEKIVIDYLSTKYKVTDVSKDKNYQKKGIDLVLDDMITADVKGDTKISVTGNLFLELVSNRYKKTDGWFVKSEMDILFYLDVNQLLLYEINFDELKDYYEKNKAKIKIVPGGDAANGALINLRDISDITTVWNIGGTI